MQDTADLARLKESIAAACRRLHARGLISGFEGNVSVRLKDGSMLITPAGVDKATLRADDVLTLDARAFAGGQYRHDALADDDSGDVRRSDSARRPSSEVQMHVTCYARRSDVQAVVHAHPPAATGMATAGYALPANLHPELPAVIGPVAFVPYARPGTPALGASLEPWLETHEVFLLSNHGVTTVGATLESALQRMESTEQMARIALVARLMGGAQLLSDDEVATLARNHSRHAAHTKRD